MYLILPLSLLQMHNRLVVVLSNLQPVVMGGFVNQALLLCATSQDKVELLDPPSEAVPGDRISFQGFPGNTAQGDVFSLFFMIIYYYF